MNRRSFISSLLAGTVAPLFLKGDNRNWVFHDSGLLTPHQLVPIQFIPVGNEPFWLWINQTYLELHYHVQT